MRAAVFSDVHGNIAALEAVLADAAAAEVDEHWIVGDLAAHGPRPAETLRRLVELPKTRMVRGNTDRYVVTGDLPAQAGTPHTTKTAEEIGQLVRVTSSFTWTRGAITASGSLTWSDSLPLELRPTLPDGTRVLLVHAAPGTDDGPGLAPHHTDEEIRTAIAGADAELIFVGHTHQPMVRTVDGVRIVNPGSVSLPPTEDRRACWTLLTADANGYVVEARRVEYDLAEVRADLDRVRHPSAHYLQHRLRDQL